MLWEPGKNLLCNRFFVEEPGGYRVSKTLRERMVFARQNLLSDPPFSRLDLISCRNLLIYIESNLQSKILPTFHYALKPGGFLLLGASESIGPFTDLFVPVDKKLRIFARKQGEMPAMVSLRGRNRRWPSLTGTAFLTARAPGQIYRQPERPHFGPDSFLIYAENGSRSHPTRRFIGLRAPPQRIRARRLARFRHRRTVAAAETNRQTKTKTQAHVA